MSTINVCDVCGKSNDAPTVDASNDPDIIAALANKDIGAHCKERLIGYILNGCRTPRKHGDKSDLPGDPPGDPLKKGKKKKAE